jgi:hypothetical protein
MNRKVLGVSSKNKNHNGGEKPSLEKIRNSKMKKLRIRINKIVADFKGNGYPLVFPSRPKKGPFLIYLSGHDRSTIISQIDLTPKSLNIEITFYKAKYKAEVYPFDDFFKSLKEETIYRDKLKKELINLLG